MLRRHGMETAAPEGERRQRSWLGASMTAPVPVRKSPGLIFIILNTMNKYQKDKQKNAG